MAKKIVPISRKEAVVEMLRVRESLKQLENEGLVTIYPHRAVEISELLTTSSRFFGIRTLLEQKAVARAIPNLTQSDLEMMHEILVQMDALSGHGGEWMELNSRFHSTINKCCRWPRLIEMINILRGNVDRYLRTYWRVIGYQKPQQQHWAPYEACRTKDTAAAEAILAEHFADTFESLLSALRDAGGSTGSRSRLRSRLEEKA